MKMNRLKVERPMADSRTIRTSMREPEDIGQELKTLIDGRDNDEIINFLEIQSSFQVQEQFKVFSLARLIYSPDCMVSYKYKIIPFSSRLVLQLSVLNDPETLSSILTWGEKIGLTPERGGHKCIDRNNPILVACQQDFKRCMDLLFQHGYRMKEFEDKDDNESEEDDQVKQFLRFQAASNIHYLSLEFTQHKAL